MFKRNYDKACFQLHRILNRRAKKEKAALLSLDYEIYNGGLRNYINNGFPSCVEKAVIKADKQKDLYLIVSL